MKAIRLSTQRLMANNPIWILIAVLIARRVGGREERGQQGVTE